MEKHRDARFPDVNSFVKAVTSRSLATAPGTDQLPRPEPAAATERIRASDRRGHGSRWCLRAGAVGVLDTETGRGGRRRRSRRRRAEHAHPPAPNPEHAHAHRGRRGTEGDRAAKAPPRAPQAAGSGQQGPAPPRSPPDLATPGGARRGQAGRRSASLALACTRRSQPRLHGDRHARCARAISATPRRRSRMPASPPSKCAATGVGCGDDADPERPVAFAGDAAVAGVAVPAAARQRRSVEPGRVYVSGDGVTIACAAQPRADNQGTGAVTGSGYGVRR
jgi:hypothetical protein